MPRPKTKIDIAELEKLYGMQCTDEENALTDRSPGLHSSAPSRPLHGRRTATSFFSLNQPNAASPLA